ncbi:MAG: hypothetical protein WBK77_10375, partial [Alphaproteobacteria bacterium]
MTDISTPRKQGLLQKFLGRSPDSIETGAGGIVLAALPFDYFGWSAKGAAFCSDRLCSLLGLAAARSVVDIQSCLGPSDAAALEGMVNRLQKIGTPFALIA